MGPVGPALELGVGLGGDEERVHRPGQLDELDEAVVGRGARAAQPALLQPAAVAGVELVAVAVALVDDLGVVGLPHDGVGPQHRRVGAEPHRAALVDDLALVVHQVDDGVRGGVVELRRVGAGQADDVAGVLDHGALQAEAQPEERDLVLPGVGDGGDLALDAPDPEPAGHDDPVEVVEAALGQEALGVLRGDPVDDDLGAVA